VVTRTKATNDVLVAVVDDQCRIGGWGGMVAVKITTIVVSMFVQWAGHPSLHGVASEATIATGIERIRAARRR
jgi:hypothetical protein